MIIKRIFKVFTFHNSKMLRVVSRDVIAMTAAIQNVVRVK